jgi:hypothetical protein
MAVTGEMDFQVSDYPTLAARRTHRHLFPGEPFLQDGNMEITKTQKSTQGE